MSPWTWVLVSFCAAGVLLALAPLFPVLRGAKRVSQRIDGLKKTKLALSIQSLQIQGERLGRISGEAADLVAREQSALTSIRSSLETLRMVEARDAVVSTGEEIEALGRDLR